MGAGLPAGLAERHVGAGGRRLRGCHRTRPGSGADARPRAVPWRVDRSRHRAVGRRRRGLAARGAGRLVVAAAAGRRGTGRPGSACRRRSISRCTRRPDGPGCSASRPQRWFVWSAAAAPRSVPMNIAVAGFAAVGRGGPPAHRPLFGERAGRPCRRTSYAGGGAVVRCAGRRWCSPSSTAASGPACCRGSPSCRCCAWSTLLAGGVVGAAVTLASPAAVVRNRVRPGVVGQDRGHSGADRAGMAQPHDVAARGNVLTAPPRWCRDRGRSPSWQSWPWRWPWRPHWPSPVSAICHLA